MSLSNTLQKLSLPLILLGVLLIPLLFGSAVPYSAKALVYSFSLTMKSVLHFCIPFIIFSFIFSSLLNIRHNVIKFILMLVGMVFISNSIAISTGFSVSFLALTQLAIPVHAETAAINPLEPLWAFNLLKLLKNETAMIAGFAFGILFSHWRNKYADMTAFFLNRAANLFLKRVFIPLLPFFILGFVFKLQHDGLLGKATHVVGPMFFVVILTQFTYVSLLYLVAARFSFPRFFRYLRNNFPALITAFSTMSSAATMPLLILCSKKNLRRPEMANIVIPATINIHTLGSAIGLTIISMTTYFIFWSHLPPLSSIIIFSFFYALAKFGVAAVPGGAIIVAAPLLEHYLGFTGEMTALVTATYLLFDPFGTTANVAGNGFFVILFSRLFNLKTHEALADEVIAADVMVNSE